MNDSIRVTLIEDNAEYRAIVKLALEQEPDFELISQFGTSEIAVRTLEQSEENQPDVILLDLRLPGMDGLDSLRLLNRCAANAKIIVLTQSDQEKDILRAISLGAAGYLLKSATVDQMTESIRTVMRGGAALDPQVAKLVLGSLKDQLSPAIDNGPLSQREVEILTLLADGLVKKQIAKKLGIGYTTVDTHVGRIYAKLNVSNAPAAVNKAHKMRLLKPDSDV